MRILLAEDEPTISRLIGHVLKSLGHSVTGLDSASDAIALVRTDPFDLILLDLNLIDGDGLRVVDELQRRPALSVPVVLMTGENSSFREDPRVAWVAGVLTKPFEIEDLESIIAQFPG
jgi:two-component system, OmpR family, response regulator